MGDSGIRILLVDDEQELVDYLAKRLTKKGHQVVGVTSGEAAMEQVGSNIFDVAVVDLKMPRMDGIELLTRMEEAQPFLQPIMLTGHGSMDTAFESGRHQAFRFLIKPYEFDALMEVIHQAREHRVAQLKEAYTQDLARVMDEHTSEPHELLRHSKQLKVKYEQGG